MLLAFDTATELVSVALHDGVDVVVELSSEQPMKHGEHLAPLIEQALGEAGVGRDAITAVVVGVGPGPFTGLRVGVVTARVLGLVLGVPVYGVCTLDALALQAVHEGTVQGGFLVATDARRKEVYLAGYDADGSRVSGPVVVAPAEAATGAAVVGRGPQLYPEQFPHGVGPLRPAAGWLARAVVAEAVEILDPEPLYLRRPDAVAGGPRKSVS